jgi:GNAT superfamily N-acetyltransferase
MKYRFAAESDLDLLAEWNHQLIQDEGHRNPMTVPQLRDRMKGWLEGEYTALLFLIDGEPVAYGLYREDPEELHLRQFFVAREQRRKGIGRQAMAFMRREIWPIAKRLTVGVLFHNRAGIHFWHSMGYRDYGLTLEIMPE